MALEREKLLKELSQKGLDVKNKSLTLPRFALKIGLITAEGSRAMSDFLDQLFTYKYPGEVILYPAHMQGESTLKDVAKGLRELSSLDLDAIVLTRGGGSAADLRWFDSPEIAYALAESRVPVISAIGHHDDVCVAELISFHREKTPTAAADFFINKISQTSTLIDNYATRLNKLLVAHEANALKAIHRLQGDLFKFSYESLTHKVRYLSHKKELLYRSYAQSLESYSHELDNVKFSLLEGYQKREFSMGFKSFSNDIQTSRG